MWAKYKNGNYIVTLNLNDGTKIRETEEDEFVSEFPESIDLTVTEQCDGGCVFCYANCTPEGKHCDFTKYDNFLMSLRPYTEVAINLNMLNHPQLIPFLKKMRKRNVIVNGTINQLHFEMNVDKLRWMCDDDLLHGLGVSLRSATPEFVEKVKLFPNAVIHVINGVFDQEEFKILKDNELKILILGYKEIGRGLNWYDQDRNNIEKNKKWLDELLPELLSHFKVISFDNLAIEQLDVRRLMSAEEWEEFYMGDDGQFSMFVNLVQGYFAKNSLDDKHYSMDDWTIDRCFEAIRGNNV